MTSPKIGAVIPVFNRAQTVLFSLESVARQTSPPSRLVIVDDGSSDNSSSTVRQWILAQRTVSEVYLLQQENRGVSAARNRGLSLMSDCHLVAFLDSDDVWPERFLEQTASKFAECPGAVAVSCDRHSFDVDGAIHHDDLRGLAENPIRWMVRHGAGVASCTLFRYEPLEQLGAFREELATGEDADLFLRLSLLGQWLHAPDLKVEYNRRRPQAMGEEGSLSSKFPDSIFRWSLVYEAFFESEHGKQFIDDPVIKRYLALQWYRAGRELAKAGCTTDARHCYTRSLAWNGWNTKTWLKRALIAA